MCASAKRVFCADHSLVHSSAVARVPLGMVDSSSTTDADAPEGWIEAAVVATVEFLAGVEVSPTAVVALDRAEHGHRPADVAQIDSYFVSRANYEKPIADAQCS